MSIPATVNLGALGISGQALLPAQAVINEMLPAASSHVLIPLPVGMTAANFVAITATNMTDLTVQFSLAVGSTVLSVPMGATVRVYGVTAVYVNSVKGGLMQVVIG